MMKITPKEIKELPEGSKVRKHSVDRQGYSQYLDLKVDKSKGFRLVYRDYYGKLHEDRIQYFKPNDIYRFYELIEKAPE